MKRKGQARTFLPDNYYPVLRNLHRVMLSAAEAERKAAQAFRTAPNKLAEVRDWEVKKAAAQMSFDDYDRAVAGCARALLDRLAVMADLEIASEDARMR